MKKEQLDNRAIKEKPRENNVQKVKKRIITHTLTEISTGIGI